MIRSFVAIRPPDDTCDRLADLGESLGEGRPVAWENLHLTLAFLDDRRPGELEDFASELDARPQRDFEIALEGLGMFGGAKPRSVHLAVRPEPALNALEATVRRAAAGAGFPLPQRRFTPHVTLVRFSGAAPASGRLPRWIEAHAGIRLPPFRAERFALYRSELTSAGPIYTEMLGFDLEPVAPAAQRP